MKNENIDVFERLRRELDKTPTGLPSTESGVEIKLLKELFSAEEARIACYLNVLPETPETIHKRIKKADPAFDLSIKQLREFLNELFLKGCLLMSESEGIRKYSLLQLVLGMWEGHAQRFSPELASLFKQYNKEIFGEYVTVTNRNQMRTIPIDQAITPEHNIADYNNVRKLLERSEGPFVVTNCVCRDSQRILGEPCKKTDIVENCLIFNGIDYIKRGNGREITKEEALEILKKNEEIGLVAQTDNSKSGNFICSCCGCCCDILGPIKKTPRPVDFVNSHYYAEVSGDLCEGCSTCIERCQMDAITMNNDIAQINLDRCIGCGVCVPTCPSEAMKLVKKEKKMEIPENWEKMYLTILKERKGNWNLLKTGIKYKMGKKN
jgi:Na+-translocating ferredoxin:NAD+ oxidoreductase subunit B